MKKLDTLLETSPRIRRASEFARAIHKGQRRKNGDPYYYHPLAVAHSLADWELDESTIVAGFLHGLHETGSIASEQIRKEFGDEVASLLDGVRDIRKIVYQGAGKDIETFRKFILQVGKDVRAMLIQLASRLDNLKLLYIQDPETQKRISLETLEVHAPLAYRLGMYKLGGELEDLAFPYLYPKEYKWILKNLNDLYETRERYVEKLKGLVEESLKAHGLKPIEMHSRAKRYASLYKKLLKHDMKLDDIYDLVALRIVVSTVEECYRALEIINRYWPPFPEGFDDYIEHPKPNGYQSLHANIYGPGKKITEIQIRTKEMHYEAELGIAARFAYDRLKDTPQYMSGGVATVNKGDSWIRRLLQWRTNPKHGLKIDLFDTNILVISPKQALIEIPAGSSALDYAFKIHSRLGLHAKEAIINGSPKPVTTKLVFGDVVQIIEDTTVAPTAEWLGHVVTSSAKIHIKSALDKKTITETSPVNVSSGSREKKLINLYHTQQTGILPAVLKLL
ncbi:MAG: HD domain-containing protein, partial [bacterium]|nr:HD domain-containing protein [bacterium]